MMCCPFPSNPACQQRGPLESQFLVWGLTSSFLNISIWPYRSRERRTARRSARLLGGGCTLRNRDRCRDASNVMPVLVLRGVRWMIFFMFRQKYSCPAGILRGTLSWAIDLISLGSRSYSVALEVGAALFVGAAAPRAAHGPHLQCCLASSLV